MSTVFGSEQELQSSLLKTRVPGSQGFLGPSAPLPLQSHSLLVNDHQPGTFDHLNHPITSDASGSLPGVFQPSGGEVRWSHFYRPLDREKRPSARVLFRGLEDLITNRQDQHSGHLALVGTDDRLEADLGAFLLPGQNLIALLQRVAISRRSGARRPWKSFRSSWTLAGDLADRR